MKVNKGDESEHMQSRLTHYMKVNKGDESEHTLTRLTHYMKQASNIVSTAWKSTCPAAKPTCPVLLYDDK